MKTVSILCTAALLGLLGLVWSETQRDGLVILLDDSYRAEIATLDQGSSTSPIKQPYESITDTELRRAVEREENFAPDTVLQTPEAVYLTDGKRGKLIRFTPSEGLKPIAVFGGKLKTSTVSIVTRTGISAYQSNRIQIAGIDFSLPSLIRH